MADKIESDARTIAELREALNPDRLADIIGSRWMGHPNEQNILAETVRVIRAGADEQTVGENK
jgi:hypothetical protein